MISISVDRRPLQQLKTGVMFIPVLQDELKIPEPIEAFLNARKLFIREWLQASHFSGKLENYRLLPTGRSEFPFLVCLGMGKLNDWDMEAARRYFGKVIHIARELKMDCPSVYWDDQLPRPKEDSIFFPEIVASMGMAAFRVTEFQTEREDDNDFELTSVQLVYPDAPDELDAFITEGQRIATAVNFARRLGEMPGNVLTPERFVEEVRQLSDSYPEWKLKILDREQLQAEGLNALLAVAAGSAHAPYLAIIHYEHPDAEETIALVGKGVTFDSGGISIKPSKSMDEMKYDMSGAGAVLATIKLVTEMKLPVNVVAAMPLVENLPSGKATRPGDIVKSYSGITIEVLNTDAEGRMILADALAYVIRNYQPQIVVDLATLTGAIIVALGHLAAGMFTNNGQLAEEFQEAGQIAGEWVWQFPIWKEYGELMKSRIADLRNISSKPGAGSITAAKFLEKFVDGKPWVHLDIAGTAWEMPERSYRGKGATGYGVRLLYHWLKLFHGQSTGE
ncbi:MAG: leucyl aminopeptidase [Calditrichaeota bacterium]|nr:leucyl aminopeptidase [Calditrichota bacterium]